MLYCSLFPDTKIHFLNLPFPLPLQTVFGKWTGRRRVLHGWTQTIFSSHTLLSSGTCRTSWRTFNAVTTFPVIETALPLNLCRTLPWIFIVGMMTKKSAEEWVWHLVAAKFDQMILFFRLEKTVDSVLWLRCWIGFLYLCI